MNHPGDTPEPEKGLNREKVASGDGFASGMHSGSLRRPPRSSAEAEFAFFYLVERLRESGLKWQLSEEEKKELTLRFYCRIVTRYDLLEGKFWTSRGEK